MSLTEVCCCCSCQVTIMRTEPRVTQRIQFSKDGGVNPTTLSSLTTPSNQSSQRFQLSLSTVSLL